MKTSKRTCKQYFNIETENDVKSVVCFSHLKWYLFQTASDKRTGCEIKNSTVKDDQATLFVSEDSTMHRKELGFHRTNEHEFRTISKVLNEVPVDTQVNVLAALEHLLDLSQLMAKRSLYGKDS